MRRNQAPFVQDLNQSGEDFESEQTFDDNQFSMGQVQSFGISIFRESKNDRRAKVDKKAGENLFPAFKSALPEHWDSSGVKVVYGTRWSKVDKKARENRFSVFNLSTFWLSIL